MVIGVFGESCTGKTTITNELSKRKNARIFTGKDYLKLAKNESDAKKQFTDLLNSNIDTDQCIIYVISEIDHLSLLPSKAIRVLVTAELDVIKERFAKRMNGTLPPPVAAMLEKKHGMFNNEKCNLQVENIDNNVSDICDKIMALCNFKN